MPDETVVQMDDRVSRPKWHTSPRLLLSIAIVAWLHLAEKRKISEKFVNKLFTKDPMGYDEHIGNI